MILKKVFVLLVFPLFLFANSCPKWAPIAMDDIFTVIPIYPYPTTASDMDCDGVSDADERRQGSNPSNPDTDGDGVGDYEDDYPTDAHKSVDTTPPVITLVGASRLEVFRYSHYAELGAHAQDDRDGSVSVAISGYVNTSTPGTYYITYRAVDARENTSVVRRTVVVKNERDTDGDGVGDSKDDYPNDPTQTVDRTPPVITLVGNNPTIVYKNGTYTELGAHAQDDRDGSVSVAISGHVNTSTPGTYYITYRAVDRRGNIKTIRRTVRVKTTIEAIVDTHSPVDSEGNRPSNVVSEFIDAFILNNRDRVSDLVGADERILAMLYNNADATTFLKQIYNNVTKIQGKHQTMGDSSVSITFTDGGSTHQGGFELMLSDANKWIIRQIY